MQNRINRGHIAPKGFTLIELLVVIAIIGILAGIVLASLGSARSKGGDAAVQGDLVGIRSQAELYSSNNGNAYTTVNVATTTTCAGAAGMFSDANVKSAITAAAGAGGGGVACAVNTAGYWVVAAQLKSDTTKAWCVASTGTSTSITWSAGALNAVGSTCL